VGGDEPSPSPEGSEPSYAVVGGGLHGVCVAAHLRAAGVGTDRLTIYDPHPELLAVFADRARRCGTRTLRSSIDHHVGATTTLASFAADRGRELELVSTTDYPRRPTLRLFLDHAHHVVARHDLDVCHARAAVTGVSRGDEAYRLDTTGGPTVADRIVLAIGLDAGLSYPAWARSLPPDAPVTHVWADGATPAELASRAGRTVVVGGGVTAGQLACRLATGSATADGRADGVTLLCRRPLRVQQAEAPSAWTAYDHLAETLHTHPPGSEARHRLLRRARADGTVPPYVRVRLRKARDGGALTGRVGEATAATATDDGVRLELADGDSLSAGAVVVATGVEPVASHPLLARLAEDLGLARGVENYPIPCDRTLAWRRTDGDRSRVFVTGAAAITALGPLAPNLAGARLAAEQLQSLVVGRRRSRAPG